MGIQTIVICDTCDERFDVGEEFVLLRHTPTHVVMGTWHMNHIKIDFMPSVNSSREVVQFEFESSTV